MSHYNIDYSSLRDEEKRTKALIDICDWLGSQDKFDDLSQAFILESEQRGLTQKAFTFYCGFAGIQGYPVIAWWEHLFTTWQEQPSAEIINLADHRRS